MNNNLKNHEAKLNKSKAWFTISIILLVISLFSAVILGSMIAKKSFGISNYEFKYNIYQSMISSAETNNNEQYEAEITKHNQDSKYGKWSYTYKLKDFRDQTVYFSTPYVYDEEQIKSPEFSVGNKIIIASTGLFITSTSDTIPISFKNVKLEDYGEYQANQEEKKPLIKAITIVGGAAVVLVIFVAINSHKMHKAAKLQLVEEKNQKAAELKLNICDYCGNDLKPGERKCKNCGAINRKK